MKKLQLVLVAALLAISTSVAVAQDPQPQGQRGGRMMAALFQGITLTADQQAKVDSITRKYMTERQNMMADQSVDQEARRTRMRDVMRRQADEIKTVLTDDQKKTFDKNLE